MQTEATYKLWEYRNTWFLVSQKGIYLNIKRISKEKKRKKKTEAKDRLLEAAEKLADIQSFET